MIENIVSSIGGPPAVSVARKYVNNAVLNLLCDFDQVQVLPASCWTFNLETAGISLQDAQMSPAPTCISSP